MARLLIIIALLLSLIGVGPVKPGPPGPYPEGLYRAREIPVGRAGDTLRIVIERDVALARTIGVRDSDPDRDGWSLIAQTSPLPATGRHQSELAAFRTVGGRPEVAVSIAPTRCLVLTPARLDAVRAGQVRGLRVLSQDRSRCVPPKPDPEPEPEPVDPDDLIVVTTPDETRRAAREIGVGGGTLTVTGADGTRYTLDVPAGALDEPTTITMAPGTVSGLETVAETVIGAVDLEPDGLEFGLPARLVVEPAAAPPGRPLFTTSHHDGRPGLEFVPSTVADDRSRIVMTLGHFSGAVVFAGTFDQLAALFTAALEASPTLAELAPGLAAATASYLGGMPAAQVAWTQSVVTAWTTVIAPLLAGAHESATELAAASRATLGFVGLLQEVGNADLGDPALTPPVDGATTVDALRFLALTRLAAATQQLQAQYLTPVCSPPVTAVKDWFTVPDFLRRQLIDLDVAAPDLEPDRLCIGRVIDGPTLSPAVLAQEDRFVTFDARLIAAVPAHTPLPAGTTPIPLPDGRIGLPGAVVADLEATGGTFAGDPSTTIVGGPDGRVTATVDRGADPEERPLDVTVAGTLRFTNVVAGIGGPIDGFEEVPITVGVGSDTLGLQVTQWDPPNLPGGPLLERILEPGGESAVCVEVTDRLDVLRGDIPVSFELDGPGSVDPPTDETRNDDEPFPGSACTVYRHPDGPVAVGETVTIEVTAESDGEVARTEVELHPYAVEVAVAARVDDEPFTPVVDGRFASAGGTPVELQVALRETVAPAGSPLAPLADAGATAVIEAGAGILSSDGVATAPLLLTTDAAGIATLRWTPGDDDTATIRIGHPDTSSQVAATVAVGPDQDVIDGNVVVRTDAEVAELAGVTRITGSLTIGGFDPVTGAHWSTVSDLTPLSSLRQVGQLNIFGNTNLVSLEGLSSLRAAGLLHLMFNPALTDLDGIDSLEELPGGVALNSNPALVDVDGLAGVTSTGLVSLRSNAALTSVAGLAGFGPSLTSLQITDNDALADLVGLDGVREVQRLHLNGAALASTDALLGLEEVHGDVDLGATAAAQVSLPALHTIHGELLLQGADTVLDVPALVRIGGKAQITGTTGAVTLRGTDALVIEGAVYVSGNGPGGEITIRAGAIIGTTAINDNDTSRIDMEVESVGVDDDSRQHLTVENNTDVDLRLHVGTVGGTLVLGRLYQGGSGGNTGFSLTEVHITRVTEHLYIENNRGISNAAAQQWASGVDVGGLVQIRNNDAG